MSQNTFQSKLHTVALNSNNSLTTTPHSTLGLESHLNSLKIGYMAKTDGANIPANNASQLLRALTAAATSSPFSAPDDWLFAQFIQRSLSTTKKRETMSEEELKNFTEMIQNQFRTIFPSGQVDSAALVASASQHALNNIYAAAALAEAGSAFEPPLSPSAESAHKLKNHKLLNAEDFRSPPTLNCCQQNVSKVGKTQVRRTSFSKTTPISNISKAKTLEINVEALKVSFIKKLFFKFFRY